MSSSLAAASPDHPFAELGLHERLLRPLAALGLVTPTAIQARAIPILLDGHDVLGQAATGTGKTAAFGLPLLQRVMGESAASPSAARGAVQPAGLVLVPTRELAIQVSRALCGFAQDCGLRIVAVYGGQDMRLQLRALRQGADIVVATPGRLVDHLQRRAVDLAAVGTVVLDEADEMLDRGFAQDLEFIVSATPEGRQTALFSATLPDRVGQMARRLLHEPQIVKVAAQPRGSADAAKVQHLAYLVPMGQKAAVLTRLLWVQQPQAAVVFCRTRAEVDSLQTTLSRGGQSSEALHGGMSQEARDKVMRRFRRQEARLLIATDVAARGLDIDHLSHVVNFDLPEAAEVYTHRVGRVGRAGRTGVAITLVAPQQRRRLDQIHYHAKVDIQPRSVPTAEEMQQATDAQALDALETALLGLEESSETKKTQARALCERIAPEKLAAAALLLAERLVGGSAESAPATGELGLTWGPSGSGGGAPRSAPRRFAGQGQRPGQGRYGGRGPRGYQGR